MFRWTLGASFMLLLFTGFAVSFPDEHAAPQIVYRNAKSAVFLVEITSDQKGKGTGFLVSQHPPLIATVAHVAIRAKEPSEVIVRANDSGVAFSVKKIHVHKDYNPDQGGKNPYSTDLALLELEVPKDTILGQPLILASPQETEDMRGMTFVTMGFPFYTTVGSEKESPEAMLCSGIVSRMVDYNSTTSAPLSHRSMIEHTAINPDGFSGSPLLVLPTGRVIAVQHGTRRHTSKTTKEQLAAIPVAIHVKELWQLLAQSGFTLKKQ